DDQTLLVLRTILEKEKYEVVEFMNPVAACEAFTKDPSQVFITDLNMPVLSGDKVIEKLNAIENPPVIIVLTARNDLNSVINLMRNGAYDYIVKPISRDELISRVEKAFEIFELRHLQKS